MKLKFLSLSFTFFIYLTVLAQGSINGIASIGSNFVNSFSYDKAFNIMSNMSLGINYSSKPLNLSLIISYGYWVDPIELDYFPKRHELGTKLEIDFLQNNSRFNPYFSASLYVELGKQNKNRMLDVDLLYPFDFPYKSTISSGSHGTNSVYKYSTRFYYKTPILSFFNFGCNVKLAEDLNLKVGIGYGLQVMKSRAYSWISNDANSQNQWLYEENVDVEATISSQPKESHFFHLLDAQVGISYSFPFKKKTKE